MRLLIVADSVFYLTNDQKYWSKSIYDYSFFKRYLEIFEEIIVISRVKKVKNEFVKGFLRVDGKNVIIKHLPHVERHMDYIKNIKEIIKYAKNAVYYSNYDCALIRFPSIPATVVYHYIKKKNMPYALEVVADPEDAYKSIKCLRKFFVWHLKKACREANGVSYVTKTYLQEKYPSYIRIYGKDERHFESYFSTIKLEKNYYAEPRFYVGKNNFNIIHVSNHMNNNLKGHIVLIKAFDILIKKGYNLSLTFIGDGKKRKQFEDLSYKLGLKDKISFIGRLIGSQFVREELLKADMLVFPTEAEGLPRVIIEAMAVGLPVISTPIAGIPELLEKEDMIPVGDIQKFAKRIEEFICDPKMMERKSKRNVDIAWKYNNDVLQSKRNEFYQKLKNLVKD